VTSEPLLRASGVGWRFRAAISIDQAENGLNVNKAPFEAAVIA
jgi:hypothetical protein